MIGANGIVRGEKVTSLARWPPNPDAGPFLWRTIGSGGLPVPVLPNVNLILEDYWAGFDGLDCWPLSTSGGVFPLTRLTTDA